MLGRALAMEWVSRVIFLEAAARHLYFNSYYYGCGVQSVTGYSRILIPDKEWNLLGHILVPNWGVRKG